MDGRPFSFFETVRHIAAARAAVWIALGLFCLSVALHAPVALFDAFGEQDAARLALRALIGALEGELAVGGQWPYAYPLYIHGMYLLLRFELVSPQSLPALMTLLSLLSSGLFSAAFFLFFRRVLGDTAAPLIGALVLQAVPAFFMSGVYGFPTLPALALLMTAAWLLSMALLGPTGRRSGRVAAVSGAILLFWAAILCKVDVVTAAGIFCLPVWKHTRSLRARSVWLCAVAGAAAVGFGLLNLYGDAISAGREAAETWQQWGRTFFEGADALFSPSHFRAVYRAVGAGTLLALGASAAVLIYEKRHRDTLLWVLAAALPGALFWMLMAGNSARHNLILASLSPMLLALPMVGASRLRRQIVGLGLAALITVNYLWYPVSASTVHPSGRLFESAAALGRSAERLRDSGRRLAAMRQDKIVVVTQNHKMPLYFFEIIAAPFITLDEMAEGSLRVVDRGRAKHYLFPLKDKARIAKAAEEAGYRRVRLYRGR